MKHLQQRSNYAIGIQTKKEQKKRKNKETLIATKKKKKSVYCWKNLKEKKVCSFKRT